MKGKKKRSGRRRAPSPALVRILVCDDQKMIRARVRRILEEIPWVTIVGEAADGKSGVVMALELTPNVVLMDVSMPELDGIEATRQILAQSPGIRIVGFSADSSTETVRRMFAAGARGFLSKTGEPSEFIQAVQSVMAGESFINIQPVNAPIKFRRE